METGPGTKWSPQALSRRRVGEAEENIGAVGEIYREAEQTDTRNRAGRYESYDDSSERHVSRYGSSRPYTTPGQGPSISLGFGRLLQPAGRADRVPASLSSCPHLVQVMLLGFY